MSNSLTMVVELCQEDRQRLDKILQGLCYIASNTVPAPGDLEVKAEAPAEAEAPKEEPKAVEPEAAPAPENKWSKADIRHAVTLLIGKGRKADARELIKQHADCIDNLPEGCIDEVFAKLKEMLGE